MIRKYYPRILAVLAAVIFFTNFDVYVYNSERLSVPPLFWIGVFAALALPYLLSSATLTIIRQAPLARWCFLYLLISCVWFLLQPSQSDAAWQELRTRALSVVFLMVALIVMAREDAHLWARRCVMIITLAAVGVNFYELFYPQTFSSVMGRAAGLYINPNQAGVALILGMIVTLDLIPSRWRLAFVLLVGTGVAVTFSRAAMTGWAIVVFITFWTRQINLRRSLAVGFTIMVISALLLAWQWDNVMDKLKVSNVLNDNVMGRLEWLNQPMADDNSSLERAAVAAIAFERFADAPLIGSGIGASRKLLTITGGLQISSHNQYLNMMVDHGLLGFLVLPLLLLASIWQSRGDERRRAITFAAFLLFMGFFSHNLLEERYTLLIYSLIAAMNVVSKKARVPALEAPRLRQPLPLPQLSSVIETR